MSMQLYWKWPLGFWGLWSLWGLIHLLRFKTMLRVASGDNKFGMFCHRIIAGCYSFTRTELFHTCFSFHRTQRTKFWLVNWRLLKMENILVLSWNVSPSSYTALYGLNCVDAQWKHTELCVHWYTPLNKSPFEEKAIIHDDKYASTVIIPPRFSWNFPGM